MSRCFPAVAGVASDRAIGLGMLLLAVAACARAKGSIGYSGATTTIHGRHCVHAMPVHAMASIDVAFTLLLVATCLLSTPKADGITQEARGSERTWSLGFAAGRRSKCMCG